MDAHLPHSVAQVGVLMPPGSATSLPQPSRSLFQPFPSPPRPTFSLSQSLFGLTPPPSSPLRSPSPPPSRFPPSPSGPPRFPFGPTPPSSGPSPGPSPSPSPLPTSSPAPAALASRYEPPPSRSFTDTECSLGLHKVTREKTADRFVEHPRDAIVEYPETGDAPGTTVAHIFHVDPGSFHHPRLNFQYSLGDGHGGRDEVVCKMLRSVSGSPVLCSKLRTMCKIARFSDNFFFVLI